MRDLLTNIKKAIKIINESKNLTIHLTDPNTVISDEAPIGVSKADWEECLKGVIKDSENSVWRINLAPANNTSNHPLDSLYFDASKSNAICTIVHMIYLHRFHTI